MQTLDMQGNTTYKEGNEIQKRGDAMPTLTMQGDMTLKGCNPNFKN